MPRRATEQSTERGGWWCRAAAAANGTRGCASVRCGSDDSEEQGCGIHPRESINSAAVAAVAVAVAATTPAEAVAVAAAEPGVGRGRSVTWWQLKFREKYRTR